MIVWDIAIEGKNDGYVKASALKAITDSCINRYYWDDLKSAKCVDEVNMNKYNFIFNELISTLGVYLLENVSN